MSEQEEAQMNDEEVKPTRTVVVAEDEALIRMDIAETLRDQGFEVVAEADNGQSAIELAEKHRPHLVLMDVKMPIMDGITAAEEISRQQLAPVVLLTAFSQKELVDRATEAGAMAYVVKPFSPHDLIPAIEVAISRYEQILALQHEVSSIKEQFETRKLVERAKSLLMTKMGLSEPESFRWIQKTSMDRRLSMKEVAETIVNQVS
ncbi:response regulator [uncultured Rothia sp.]|uniref:ANTAR domain-containing response regulator n=1 Tax=uncultured Rothia sp. TaxID=316088 RepID=UPI003218101C